MDLIKWFVGVLITTGFIFGIILLAAILTKFQDKKPKDEQEI